MISKLLKVGDWDITFDGEHLAKYFVVCKVDMTMLPEISINEVQIAGRPGSWYSSRQIGTRDVTIRLGLLNETRDRIESLENWVNRAYLLSKDQECKLELGDYYYVNAVLVGQSPITRRQQWNTVDLTFRCCDPYIYRREFEVPLVSGDNTVVVTGTCPAWPVFEITGGSSTFQLRNMDTGHQVKVDTLSSTAKLIVDMKRRRCEIGGAYKAADPTVTDFWPLNPGENNIRLQTGSGVLRYTEVFI